MDDRLQLPEAKFSYLLQDWSQSLAVEMSYSQVCQVLNNMLSLDIGASSLERITNDFAGDAEIDWDHSPAVPSAEGTFIVATADGKGVPIRKSSSSAPIVDHDPGKKPPADRKKMALLGAVYDSQPYIRTPEQVVEKLFGEPLRKNEAAAANEPVFVQRPQPHQGDIIRSIRNLSNQPRPNACKKLSGRDTIIDPLTELLRTGAKQLVYQAVEAELLELLAEHSKRQTEDEKAGVVRNGYLPERELQTGVGPVTVRIPKVRAKTSEPATFRSALAPAYVRKTQSLEAALP